MIDLFDVILLFLEMMLSVSQSLITLGDVGEGQGALGGTLLRILSKYASSVSSSLEGRTAADGSVEMTELHGGARIAFVFNEIFGRLLWGMDPFEGLDDEDIRTAIANANGTRPSLFVPEISFDLLVRRQIARLEAPGIQCVEMVLEELQRLAQHCESQMPELQRFPVLRDRVLEVVSDMLRGCVKPAQNMVSSLVQVELAYVNTSHPDFIGGKQALAQVTKKAAHASAEASSTSGGVGMDSVVLSSTGAPSTPVPSSSNQTSGTMPPSMSPEPNRGAASMSNANTPAAGFFGLFRPPSNQPFPGASSDQQMMSGSATNSQQTPGNGVGRPLKPPTMRQPQHQPNPNLSSSRDSSGLVKLPQMPDRMKVTAGTNDWGR